MPRTARILGQLVVPALLAALMVSVLPTGQPARDSRDYGGVVPADHHVPVPPGDGRQFVWPVDAWVAANHQYANGNHHGGTADLAAHHHTPVKPARPGVVALKNWTNAGGWRLRIEHDEGGSHIYRSFYGHLAEEPPVSVGQRVTMDTVVGHLSRTGNADFSGPHIHFVLSRENRATGATVTLRVPGLTIGDWVRSGQYVPGVYEGLDPLPAQPGARPFDVRVTQSGGLIAYQTTARRTAERLVTLPAGTTVTVLDSDRGQYLVTYQGHTGWIPLSGVVPAGSPVFGVRIEPSATNVNVRRGPSTSTDVIGRVGGGTRLTAFEQTSNGWFRVQWRCTEQTNRSRTNADNSTALGGCPDFDTRPQSVKYGWVGPAVAYTTSYFPARTRIAGLNVYASRTVGGEQQPDTDRKLGELNIRAQVTVTGSRNGWYRLTYNNQTAWIRGWFTAARQ